MCFLALRINLMITRCKHLLRFRNQNIHFPLRFDIASMTWVPQWVFSRRELVQKHQNQL